MEETVDINVQGLKSCFHGVRVFYGDMSNEDKTPLQQLKQPTLKVISDLWKCLAMVLAV